MRDHAYAYNHIIFICSIIYVQIFPLIFHRKSQSLQQKVYRGGEKIQRKKSVLCMQSCYFIFYCFCVFFFFTLCPSV